MEHNPVTLSRKTGISDPGSLSRLIGYAEMVYKENKKFNLTGYKTLTDIIENLITGSLSPLLNMNVPRGTLFADLGTGAGFPGVPIAVKYPGSTGLLFDSNHKKISFINKTASALGINNLKGVAARIEEAGRMPEYREQFDFVFTRAMADVYTVAELGSPLLKTGGYLYIYANTNQMNESSFLADHVNKLGLAVKKNSDPGFPFTQTTDEGIVMSKINQTDDKYPRRIAVIKRMAGKIEI